jgi:DNA-binding SARP family transcriptional activator/tetratricopeptide (TPR) repeat protein
MGLLSEARVQVMFSFRAIGTQGSSEKECAVVRFAILGPLLVHDGEAQIDVPKGRVRVLLAALLLHTGSPVPAGVLTEAAWEGVPPPGADATLRSHVARLRRALGPRAGARLVTRHPGYVLQAVENEVDVLRFRRLCRDGAAGLRDEAWERADGLLAEALGLWRGTPLTGIPSESSLLRDEVPALEALRLQAEEWRADAALRLGRHDELIPRLQTLTAQHPLREGFHAQLMLGLYRCGRQAEALAAYQRARGILIAELGIEPGPNLRELHQRMLSADPVLAVGKPARVKKDNSQPAVPRELPPAVRGFTGRAAELEALTRLLDQPAGQVPEPAAVVISVIGGMAGVGKTALAVQWAHQMADQFPGGQLYVNLRGYDPDRPVSAADALAGLLLSLGMPGQDIPPEEDQRAARYRSLLAGEKVLVLLDNAVSVDQVRGLLPGSAGCVVVVTSRDALAGLVARHGAARLELDPLPPADAVGLLRTLIGPRVDDDPGAAAELASQCSLLPLALRLAAELAGRRPDVPLAGLVAELADQRRRLDLLDAGGDPRTAVRAVFSWSYRHLAPDTARVFRLAGLHPGADFDPYAAAAFADLTLEQARQALDALTRAHLIWPAGSGRYGLHDLMRAYARELAARDGEEERDASLTRLFDHYLRTAATAMDTLHPSERHRRPRIPPPSTPAPQVTERVAARAWLDDERAALVTVIVDAAARGWHSHATRLGHTLFRYLANGGHYAEAVSIHSHARAAAQRTGDRAAEAHALNGLAGVDYRQGRYEEAADLYRQALALFRQADDRPGQAYALSNLGIIEHQLSRYRAACDLIGQALAIHRETGDRYGEGVALANMAGSEALLGRYDLSARHYRQALVIGAGTGASQIECSSLVGLGLIGLRQGRYAQAAAHLHRALARSRQTGFRDNEAESLARIGDLSLRRGRPEEADSHLRQALALYRELGNPSGEADALNSLGEVLLAIGQPNRAATEYAAALGVAIQADNKYQQARAHRGLGRVLHADGARRHLRQALDLFTELDTPEAGQIRAAMATEAHDRRP